MSELKVKGFKLSEQEIQRFNNLRAQSGIDKDSLFFISLLNRYEAPENQQEGNQNEALTRLIVENERLETEVEALQVQVNSLQNALVQAEGNLATEQNRRKTEPQPETENLLKIQLNPAMAELLDICALRASKKTGKEFNRERVILNLFWEAISQGRASLPVIFSTGEIQNTIQKHKTAE